MVQNALTSLARKSCAPLAVLLVAALCASCGTRLELRERRWARVVEYSTAINALQSREKAVWDRFEDVSKHFASHTHMERVMNGCAKMALALLATLTAMDPPPICKEAHELKQKYWLKASKAFVYQSREGADAGIAETMITPAGRYAFQPGSSSSVSRAAITVTW